MKPVKIQWTPPPETLYLSGKTVHIWLINEKNPDIFLLDKTEQKRAKKLRFKAAHHNFIKAHSGLRRILSKYTHQAPHEIVYNTLPSGRPALKDFPGIHFSLSHSKDVILCAISLNPIGLDTEYCKPDIHYKALLKRFFNPEISASIKNPENFYQLWTAKEACFKLKTSNNITFLKALKNNLASIPICYFVPHQNYMACLAGNYTMINYFFLQE